MRSRNLPDNGEEFWTPPDVRFVNFKTRSTNKSRVLRFSVNASKMCREVYAPRTATAIDCIYARNVCEKTATWPLRPRRKMGVSRVVCTRYAPSSVRASTSSTLLWHTTSTSSRSSSNSRSISIADSDCCVSAGGWTVSAGTSPETRYVGTAGASVSRTAS